MTKFILLSLQIYSINIICVMHFCDRSYKTIFLDGLLSSVITVTLQYLQWTQIVSDTRFTEKNKVWAKDVLFVMNFKCAPLRSLRGDWLHLKIYLINQDKDNKDTEPKEKMKVVKNGSGCFFHHQFILNTSLLLLAHWTSSLLQINISLFVVL